MPPNAVNKGVRAIAEEAGCSPALVTRKLRQGKSREQIIAEAKAYREKQNARKAVNATSEAVNEPGKIEDFVTAQRRKESALADLRELELAQKRGESLDAAAVSTAWHDMISTAKSRLLLVSDELGDRLASESNPIRCREMLADKIRHALSALSERTIA